MALSMEQKNARRREARKAKAGPNKTAGGNAAIAVAVLDSVAAALKRPTLTLVKKPVDEDMPTFMNRTDPEVEKAAVVAREKRADEIRKNPPVSAAPAVKPTTKAANKTTKPQSMYQATRHLVVNEPNITIEALMKTLKAQGFATANQSTVATFRADTRNTMLLVQKLKGIDLGCVA